MELPEGFLKLLKDFDPKNLNKMPAAEVIKAFNLLKDSIYTLNRIKLCTENPTKCELTGMFTYDAEAALTNWADEILNRYKEWK